MPGEHIKTGGIQWDNQKLVSQATFYKVIPTENCTRLEFVFWQQRRKDPPWSLLSHLVFPPSPRQRDCLNMCPKHDWRRNTLKISTHHHHHQFDESVVVIINIKDLVDIIISSAQVQLLPLVIQNQLTELHQGATDSENSYGIWQIASQQSMK